VIIGVNERGEKHFLAIEDGVRESAQSLSRDGILHMMFKLGMCAQKNWRSTRV
jgi:hypothetical protein